jgi:hypothetical protein
MHTEYLPLEACCRLVAHLALHDAGLALQE